MDKKRPKSKTSTNNTKTINVNIKNNKQSSEKIIYFPKQITSNQKQYLHPFLYEKPKPSEIISSPQSSSKPMKSERKSILSKVIFLDKNKQYININPNVGIKSKLIDKSNLLGINVNNDNRKISENEIYVNYTAYKHNNNVNDNQAANDGNSLMLNKNMIYKRKKSKDHCVQRSEKRRYICNTPVLHEKIKTKIVFDNISEDNSNKMTIQQSEKGNYLIRGFSVGDNLYKHKTKSFISPNMSNNNFIIDTPDINPYSNEYLFIDNKRHSYNNEQLSKEIENICIQSNINKSNFIIVNHDQKETNVKSYSDSKSNINKLKGQSSSTSIISNNNNKMSSNKKTKRDYDFLAPVVKISLDLDKEGLIHQKEDNIINNNSSNNKHPMKKINQFKTESANVITKGVPDLSLLSTNRTDNLTNITIETHKTNKPSNKIQKQNQNQLYINKDEIQTASSLTITPHHTSHKFFPHKTPLTPSSSSSNTNNSISNREFISFLRNSVHHKSIIPESLCNNLQVQQDQNTRVSFRNNAKNTSSFINDNLITINNFRHKVLNDVDKNNVCTLTPSHDLFAENQKERNESSDISNYHSNSNYIRKFESESNLTKLMNKEPHSIESKIRSHFGSFNGLKQNFDFSGEQIERNNSCNKKYNLIYDYEKIGKELMDDVQQKNGVNKNNTGKKRIIGSNSFVNHP